MAIFLGASYYANMPASNQQMMIRLSNIDASIFNSITVLGVDSHEPP
jgi:hypothetical protein